MHQLENFYLKTKEPNRSLFLALREIFLSWEDVEECLKYGGPCFTYKGKIAWYHWQDKKSEAPYILFNHGKLINHPLLESKGRKLMKSLDLDPNADIPIKVIEEICGQVMKVIEGKVKAISGYQ